MGILEKDEKMRSSRPQEARAQDDAWGVKFQLNGKNSFSIDWLSSTPVYIFKTT